MQLFKDLFTTDVGLMSAIGIAFMLGMGAFYLRYFSQHMKSDAAAAKARGED